MGRKERCPQCGSKKITITGNLKKCKVCKKEARHHHQTHGDRRCEIHSQQRGETYRPCEAEEDLQA